MRMRQTNNHPVKCQNECYSRGLTDDLPWCLGTQLAGEKQEEGSEMLVHGWQSLALHAGFLMSGAC